jgi:hypothetical protein
LLQSSHFLGGVAHPVQPGQTNKMPMVGGRDARDE